MSETKVIKFFDSEVGVLGSHPERFSGALYVYYTPASLFTYTVEIVMFTGLNSGYSSTTHDSTTKYTISAADSSVSGTTNVNYANLSDTVWKEFPNHLVLTLAPGTYNFLGDWEMDCDYLEYAQIFGEFTLPDIVSSCTAPTSVSVSSGAYYVPGTSFTVSWNGAAAGTENAITGYKIYWKKDASPTISSYDGVSTVSTTTTSGSTSMSLSSPTRGSIYYFKVQTLGTVSGYDSTISSVGEDLYVNRLPAAPAVSVNKTVVPSTGGAVKFTISGGADPDGSTVIYKYATSSTGTKTTITSGTSLTVSGSGTQIYYFYSYDGYEYSSAKTVSITINTKPTLSGSVNATTYNFLGASGTGGKRKNWSYICAPTITSSKTGTLYVSIYSAKQSDYTYTTSYSGTSLSTQTYTYTINTTYTSSLNIFTILNSVSTLVDYTGQTMWYLSFKVNDGYEDSSNYYWPSSSGDLTVGTFDGYFYSIAPAPNWNAASGSAIKPVYYNSWSGSTITGTSNNILSTQLKVYFPYTSSFSETTSNITFVSDIAGLTYAVEAIGHTSTQSWINVTVSNSTNSQVTSTPIIRQTLLQNATLEFSIGTIYIIPTPNLSNTPSNGNTTTIKPFTDDTSKTFNMSIAWPFGNTESLDDVWDKYQINNEDSIEVIYTLNNYSYSMPITSQSGVKWRKESDSLICTMTADEAFFEKDDDGNYIKRTNWNITTAGTISYQVAIQITNLYGEIMTSNALSCTFDFREAPVVTSAPTVKWALSSSPETWYSFSSSSRLGAGMYLQFTVSYSLFTAEDAILSLQLNNGVTTYIAQTFTPTDQSYAASPNYRSRAVNTKTFNVYGPIGEITTNNNRIWSVIATTSGGSYTSSTLTTLVTKQTKPSVLLTKCEIEESNNSKIFNYSYTFSDLGIADNNQYISLCLGETGDSGQAQTALFTSYSTCPSGTITGSIALLSSVSSDWDAKNIALFVESYTQDARSTTTWIKKNYQSNSILVYNISPTVAYRKNQIGINTGDLANATDAAVVIHPGGSGHDRVYLEDTNGTMYVDLADKKIDYYNSSDTSTVIASVDFSNQRIEGFDMARTYQILETISSTSSQMIIPSASSSSFALRENCSVFVDYNSSYGTFSSANLKIFRKADLVYTSNSNGKLYMYVNGKKPTTDTQVPLKITVVY